MLLGCSSESKIIVVIVAIALNSILTSIAIVIVLLFLWPVQSASITACTSPMRPSPNPMSWEDLTSLLCTAFAFSSRSRPQQGANNP